jgi:hypothetical protein
LTQTAKTFVDESRRTAREEEAYRQQILTYERVRKERLEKYVTPYLASRIDELKRLLEQLHVGSSSVLRKQAEIDLEINEIENFLSAGGKWHTGRAFVLRKFPDNMCRWEFSCCNRKIMCPHEPSQFRIDGCNESPIAVRTMNFVT